MSVSVSMCIPVWVQMRKYVCDSECMHACTCACEEVCLNLSVSSCVFVHVQVRKYVMEQVNKAGKAKKLRGFEMIKSVWLDEEPWSGVHPAVTLVPCSSPLTSRTLFA